MGYGMDEAGLFPAWIWCVDGSFRYHGLLFANAKRLSHNTRTSSFDSAQVTWFLLQSYLSRVSLLFWVSVIRR
jgi:hypothetical protein